MKKLLFFAPLLFITQLIYAQGVGINTLKPEPSAALDIVSETKGLLIPRVGLKTLTDGKTVSKPAHSLLVYNTNENLPGGEGYYFNAGTKDAPDWKKISIDSSADKIAFSVEGISTGNDMVPPLLPTKISFGIEGYDLGNDYTGAGLQPENAFKVPVSGIYHFDVKLGYNQKSPTGYEHILKLVRVRNGNTMVIAQCRDVIGFEFLLSCDRSLEAGDEVYVEVFHKFDYNGNALQLINNLCYFNGRLVVKL